MKKRTQYQKYLSTSVTHGLSRGLPLGVSVKSGYYEIDWIDGATRLFDQ